MYEFKDKRRQSYVEFNKQLDRGNKRFRQTTLGELKYRVDEGSGIRDPSPKQIRDLDTEELFEYRDTL